jgi:hypothetical protein
MSHSNTQRLTDYWRQRRGVQIAPFRTSIDPRDFAGFLPQVFMLGRSEAGRYLFRLGGGLIEDLHGRGLRRAEFAPLWATADRPRLHAAMEAALRRGLPLLVEAEGHTREGQTAQLEIVMAPLISNTGRVDRFLGLYQPISPLSRLGDRPLDHLCVKTMRAMGPTAGDDPQALPALRLAVLDGRRIA